MIKLGITNKPGLPDLMLLKDGVTLFVEVKRSGCVPTPLQQRRADELRAIGFEVQVVTGVDRND